MTAEELLHLLANNLKNTKYYTPVNRGPQKPSKTKKYSHNFYDIVHLSLLTEQLKGLSKPIDEEDYQYKFSIRYLVDIQGRIIFAREGKPGALIPAHKQIASMCLAAGNIFFNQDYSKIIKINNESGDFHPESPSLVHPLAILLATALDLVAEELLIDITLSASNKKQVTLTTAQLLSCLHDNLDSAKKANSAWDNIKTESNRNSAQFFNSSPERPTKKGKAILFNLPDDDEKSSQTTTNRINFFMPEQSAASSAFTPDTTPSCNSLTS